MNQLFATATVGWYNLVKRAMLFKEYGYWLGPDGTLHAVPYQDHMGYAVKNLGASENNPYDSAFAKGFVRIIGPYRANFGVELGLDLPRRGKSITQQQFDKLQNLISQTNIEVRKDETLQFLRVTIENNNDSFMQNAYTASGAIEFLRKLIKKSNR